MLITIYQRAAQIWAVLMLAARNRQVLSYDIVGKLIGVPRQGLGRLLEPIQSFCLINGYPPLTILVVSDTTGMPGTGFIASQDIPRHQVAVFGHDWSEVIAPTPAILEAAVQQRPSNGTTADEAPASL